MGTYREYSEVMDGAYRWEACEVYQQPAWRHHLSWLANAVTAHTPRLEMLLDVPLTWLHERRCHDDCGGVMTSWHIKPEYAGERRSEAPASPRQDPDGKYFDRVDRVRCRRMGFPAEVSFWVYRLSTKGRVKLRTEDGPRQRRTETDDWQQRIVITNQALKRMRD